MAFKCKTTALACVAILSASLAAQADEGTNKITFTGTVIDQACTVDINDGSTTLDLGSTAAADIAAKGQTGAPKEFAVVLSSCPVAAEGVPTKAFVKFSGATDGDTSYFQNDLTGADAATNTGVQIKDNSGTPIVNNDGNTAINLPAAGGDISLTYTASLVATAATPGKGNVSSAVTYSVSYQ